MTTSVFQWRRRHRQVSPAGSTVVACTPPITHGVGRRAGRAGSEEDASFLNPAYHRKGSGVGR